MTAPFRILVVDDSKDLARDVQALLPHGVEVEVLACLDPRMLARAMDEDGPFDVIVAGPALADAEGIEILGRRHRADPSTYLLLAFARVDFEVSEIVRVGASDLVDVRDDDAVGAALADALATVADWRAHQPSRHRAEERPRGRVFTVCSATGGCGKTFFATNLATYLARNSGGRVVLVDLDLQFGEVAASLRLQPVESISELLDSGMADPDPEDVESIGELEEFMTPSGGGLHVLPAPKDPVDADRVKPSEVGRLIDLLASRYDYVVVDTPTGLTELVLAALDVSQRLFIMASLDVMSVRNLRVFIDTLHRLDISAESLSLVLNKAQRGVGITVEDVSRVFDPTFETVIPFSREVPRSMNEGVPLLDASPQSDVGRILETEFRPYLPAEVREQAAAAANTRGGWLRRLARSRRSA